MTEAQWHAEADRLKKCVDYATSGMEQYQFAQQLSAHLHKQPVYAATDSEEVFMCGVDYQHHLHDDAWGTRVYASEDDLRAHRKCVDQCGIVAVKVTLVRWVQEQSFDDDATVAQPANTDSVPGSPGSESARPSEQEQGGSSIGLGAEGEQ